MARLRAIDVELMDPIEFANSKSGLKDTATHVTLEAPSSKHKRKVSKLVCLYRRAENERLLKVTAMSASIPESKKEEVRKQIKKDEEEKEASGNADNEDKVTPDDVLSLMESFGDDMDSAFDAFRDTLVAGCGYVADDIPMTAELFDLLSYEDMRYLCGRYLADFLLVSRKERSSGAR